MDWPTLAIGALAGGSLVRLVELLIALVKERREQQRELNSSKSAKEKDRPRFRVDASVLFVGAAPPTVLVKILSLGSLPITINDGYVSIESIDYPEATKPQSLQGKEVSSPAPIELKIPVKHRVLHPQGPSKGKTKLICKFSYGDGETYEDEKTYNQQTRQFE